MPYCVARPVTAAEEELVRGEMGAWLVAPEFLLKRSRRLPGELMGPGAARVSGKHTRNLSELCLVVFKQMFSNLPFVFLWDSGQSATQDWIRIDCVPRRQVVFPKLDMFWMFRSSLKIYLMYPGVYLHFIFICSATHNAK